MASDSWEHLFTDVTPLEQDDGPVPVVRIQYTPWFAKVMGFFRRILVDNEHSSRTMLLSKEVIEQNAANYTAWQYRRTCLREIHKNSSAEQRWKAWSEEKDFCTEQCTNNPKNYQVWFHRRACVLGMSAAAAELKLSTAKDAAVELEFIASVLSDENKNYHAWGHRQWALKHFGTQWEGELAFIDELLEEDVRNNSAWNQRYFVLQNTADLKSAAVVGPEVDYALKAIRKAPNNSSPWNYLEGLVAPLGFAAFPQVRKACEDLGGRSGAAGGDGATAANAARCIPALALLTRVLEDSGAAADAALCKTLCGELSSLDPIRERFWRWRAAQR